ncbi:MAG: hypothetical protein RML94_01790 [Bacteroidia bacterium]|nr:hypothetical protein [Bacteroidia bacterium]
MRNLKNDKIIKKFIALGRALGVKIVFYPNREPTNFTAAAYKFKKGKIKYWIIVNTKKQSRLEIIRSLLHEFGHIFSYKLQKTIPKETEKALLLQAQAKEIRNDWPYEILTRIVVEEIIDSLWWDLINELLDRPLTPAQVEKLRFHDLSNSLEYYLERFLPHEPEQRHRKIRKILQKIIKGIQKTNTTIRTRTARMSKTTYPKIYSNPSTPSKATKTMPQLWKRRI